MRFFPSNVVLLRSFSRKAPPCIFKTGAGLLYAVQLQTSKLLTTQKKQKQRTPSEQSSCGLAPMSPFRVAMANHWWVCLPRLTGPALWHWLTVAVRIYSGEEELSSSCTSMISSPPLLRVRTSSNLLIYYLAPACATAQIFGHWTSAVRYTYSVH